MYSHFGKCKQNTGSRESIIFINRTINCNFSSKHLKALAHAQLKPVTSTYEIHDQNIWRIKCILCHHLWNTRDQNLKRTMLTSGRNCKQYSDKHICIFKSIFLPKHWNSQSSHYYFIVTESLTTEETISTSFLYVHLEHKLDSVVKDSI